MNAENPAQPENTQAQRNVDTVRAAEGGTLVDIDQYVREAKQHAQQELVDDHATQLIVRLANLDTIRSLAAGQEPRPTLGAYELLEEIGRGGMGKVYRAKHKQLGKIQALKVIQNQSGLTKEIRARFRREVQAIGALEHPNIISAHAADFEGDVPYLVMDYVEGESLAQLQKRLKAQGSGIPVGAACELIRQAALGLQYAHDRKITHRDIKPGNLMLDGEGTIRVLDLGLARLGDREEPDQEATELTRGGQILGTPDYMSPEQLQSSRDVDARTDVYALGVTLFSLLVGRPVYKSRPGESFIAKASRILHKPVPDLRKLMPDVPKRLADIIAKCLAKSPEDRIQSAGELAEALGPWADGEEVRTLLPGYRPTQAKTAHDPATQTTAESNSHGLGTIVAGIAAAILLPLLIAAGVILTLRLPGGGELVVDCDDPSAKIQVVAVKGGERKDLSLSQETGNKLRLEEGRWTVHIEGVEAASFSLSEDEVVINGDSPSSIRVTRKDSASETGVVSNVPGVPVAGVPADPAATSTVRPPASRDLDERIVDWQALPPSSVFRGLLPEPHQMGNGAQWQLRPCLPPLTQHAHYLTENRVSIDPTGQLYAVISPYDCKVMELSSGRVTHTIASPKDSSWGGVAISADAKHVALLSQYGHFAEVRDARNRIAAHWNTTEQIDTANSYGAIAWLKPGEQLLVWDHHRASVVDLDGKVVTSIEFEMGAGPEQDLSNGKTMVQRCVEADPTTQNIAFGCSDGRVRIWNLAENELRILPTGRGDEPVRSVHWSPDGKYVAAMRSQQWIYGVALEIWDADLKLLNTIEGEQLNGDHQAASEFAWSPDSRSIALGSGKLADLDGKLLRELHLLGPTRDHGSSRVTSVWIPSWSTTKSGTQRIDFVANGETYGLQCGRVRSFTPTGGSLPSSQARNVLKPQAWSWIKETGELAVVYSNADSSELRAWTKGGEPHVSVAIPRFVSGRIQSTTGRLLCHTGSEMSIFDPNGKLLGNYPHGSQHDFELGNWQWNQAGDRIANFGRTAAGGVIRIVDTSGETIREWPMPKEVTEAGFDLSTQYLYWSPDDKFLAMSVLLHDSSQHVFVWNLAEDPPSPSFELILDDTQTPLLSWSPDSMWLCIAPGTVDSENGTKLRFLHVSTGRVQEHVSEHDYYPQWHAPEWFNGRSIRIGGLAVNMPEDIDGEIRVRDLGFLLESATVAVNMNKIGSVLLVTQDDQGQKQFEIWQDGKILSTKPAPAIAGTTVSTNAARTKAVFALSDPHDAFAQVSLLDGTVNTIVLALDNGRTIELSPEGTPPSSGDGSSDYLAYTIRYSSGVEVTVGQAEFDGRKLLSTSEAALQWILDVGGFIQVENNEGQLTNRSTASGVTTAQPSQIVSIGLSGCLLTNESLAQLVHFPKLEVLDLSKTRITSLNAFPELPQLNELDLSHTEVDSLKALPCIDTVRLLDVSNTPIDSSVADALASAENLENLDLAGTRVDRFVLQRLSQLTNLAELDVRQTDITAEDISSFRQSNLSTSVLGDD